LEKRRLTHFLRVPISEQRFHHERRDNVKMPVPQTGPAPVVSDDVHRSAASLRGQFLAAEPFKHVVVENFFEPAFAEQLLAEFPRFDPTLARNEAGRTGGKAVNTELARISPAYQRLYDALSSRAFLDFVSELTGIPDLLHDPLMFGGGTHENLHGQDLDPHVDFNYDQSRRLHRRLNLIVYMNKEWRPEWGGSLELHSNPRDPYTNRIFSYEPRFNRCVLFETNEYSWHGFPEIRLPEHRRDLSRKSISIYLYTRERPVEEVAPVHATFYVQRPLPPHFSAGQTLTEGDVLELRRMLGRRDEWIKKYQQLELDRNREIAELAAGLTHSKFQTRAPVTGYVLHEGDVEGLYPDMWAASRVRLSLRPLLPVSGLLLRGYRPESAPAGKIRVLVNGEQLANADASSAFEIQVAPPQSDRLEVEIAFDGSSDWIAEAGEDRDLAFVMMELRALHPGCASPE
jgi:hypothetical protein